jgi:SAM-dependent methyltransferase
VIDPSADAFGQALLDQLDGLEVTTPRLETDAGWVGPAMHPEWFFRAFADWDWWEQELLPQIASGPVLDLGCGAGRSSLWLQDQGFDVTAVDFSPGAVEVCRRRGVRDVRLADVLDPPSDLAWAAVLLLCGNLGLGGSWDGSRRLLRRLATITRPDAVLIGDSVTPDGLPDVRLRVCYRDKVTPWWPQYNIPADDLDTLVAGTGWRVDRHLVDGDDHAALLRRIQ